MLLKTLFFAIMLLAFGNGINTQCRAVPLSNWLERPVAEEEIIHKASASDSLPSVQLPAEFDRVLRDYERLWKAGDAAGLAKVFTPDGFATQRGRWVQGRDAVTAAYGWANGDLKLRALSYAADGDVGYIVGAYGYGEAADTPDRGKFVLALKRVDGRWLIAADLDSPIPNQ